MTCPRKNKRLISLQNYLLDLPGQNTDLAEYSFGYQFLAKNSLVIFLGLFNIGLLTLILTFIFQCMKLEPTTFKLRGIQPKLSKLMESYATNLRGASAELSSSDSGSQA